MAAAERRRAQEAAAATVLAAALACLSRGPGAPREPLTAAALARPSLKTMQAALHLLHLRIRGAARTKKELQHIYPVLEPGQAKEFKAAMQEWVRELGAAGQLQPDSVKYFVSAYQGSAAHRGVLLLLDLSTLALAKELGEGPQAALPNAELLRPCCSTGTAPTFQAAQQAAADAQRQLQARMDAVVAAMQRLKQLHVQAAAQLAAGQAASGAAAAALAPRMLPLFAGSQAAAKRGELVSELLAQGPSLTAQPEAVGPESWADLLAAGRGSAAGAAAGAGTPPPATARRLSNPAQEASNFAAEGMAADADVLTVHSVLVRRLAAAGVALQAAGGQGGAACGAELRAALAEAATCRESLMLSVRQELVAARVRAEQQAAAAASDGKGKPSLLQLLPPSQPPSNPVSDGIRAAQQAAAAAAAEEAGSGWSTTPDAADVRALRRSTWRQLLQSGCGSGSPSAVEAAAPDSPSAASAVAETQLRPLQDAASPVHVAAGSSSGSAARVRPSAAAADSPSLEALISQSSKGLHISPLLASLDDRLGSPLCEGSYRQSGGGSRQQQQQQSGSPCMAESCASVSIASGSGRQAAGFSRPLRLAMSPMQSAAASFIPPRPQHSQQQRAEAAQQQPGGSMSPAARAGAARGAPPSPPLPLFESLSPQPGSPAAPQQADSDNDSSRSGSPVAPARSWRHEAAATAAAADTASPASGTSSRRRAASVAFTPPRRLGDSPLPEPQLQRPQQLAGVSSPLAPMGGNCTPVSKLQGDGGGSSLSPLHAATPAPSPILQPVQQQHQRAQQSWRHGGSPGSPQLLASCFKSKPLALSPFAAAPSSPLADQQQEQPWTLAAARSPSAPAPAGNGSLDSPRSSAGRRRSKVITTSSPRPSAHSRDALSPALPHRLASSGAHGSQAGGGSDLVSGLRALDSPVASSLTSRPAPQYSMGASRGGGSAATAGAGGGAFDLAELQRRLLAIDRSKAR